MSLVPQYEETGMGTEEGRREEEEGEREEVCHPLESLGLGGNKIGDAGAQHLATGLTTNISELVCLVSHDPSVLSHDSSVLSQDPSVLSHDPFLLSHDPSVLSYDPVLFYCYLFDRVLY